jgi:hypothetical protein
MTVYSIDTKNSKPHAKTANTIRQKRCRSRQGRRGAVFWEIKWKILLQNLKCLTDRPERLSSLSASIPIFT